MIDVLPEGLRVGGTDRIMPLLPEEPAEPQSEVDSPPRRVDISDDVEAREYVPDLSRRARRRNRSQFRRREEARAAREAGAPIATTGGAFAALSTPADSPRPVDAVATLLTDGVCFAGPEAAVAMPCDSPDEIHHFSTEFPVFHRSVE